MVWFYYSLLVLIFYGIKDFLLKIGVQNKCSEVTIMFTYSLSVWIIGTLLFAVHGGSLQNIIPICVLAFYNGILSIGVNVFRYSALKYLPAAVAYPLFRSSILFVVIGSFLFLHENLTTVQYLGIVLILLSSQLIARRDGNEKKKYKNYGLGMLFIAGAILCNILTPFLVYRAVEMHTDIAFFIAASYFFSTMFLLPSLFLHKSKKKKHFPTKHFTRSIVYGVLIGGLNFAGFFSYMLAQQTGTVALVSVVSSLSVIVLVGFCAVLYKERLTVTRIIGVAISIVSLLLLQV